LRPRVTPNSARLPLASHTASSVKSSAISSAGRWWSTLNAYSAMTAAIASLASSCARRAVSAAMSVIGAPCLGGWGRSPAAHGAGERDRGDEHEPLEDLRRPARRAGEREADRSRADQQHRD